MILEEMVKEDSERVVEIISSSMNENEGMWAKENIATHWACKKHDINDGKVYWLAKKDGQIVGITGLHIYGWGPKDASWLGWFAVDPEFQRQGIGHMMMGVTCQRAAKMGIKRLFIETYSNDDFLKGRNFYEKFGFRRVGRIENYLGNNIDMVVYGRDLG